MRRKQFSKKFREKLWLDYNKRCAYCGEEIELKDMQIDHISSVYFNELYNTDIDVNQEENLLPACRSCNYYKGTNTVEEFRNNLTNMLMRNVRIPFDYRLAIKYGLVQETGKENIKFYFETMKDND